MKTSEIEKKKRKIIIIFCILGFLLMICVGFGLGNLAYNLNSKNQESIAGDVNKLDSDNKLNEEGENNVLLVGIDEKNDTNEVNETNDEQVAKPSVDAPYYIKVNNQANVVTIYKKDSKRKVYSSS